jgi:hypothetical protein
LVPTLSMAVGHQILRCMPSDFSRLSKGQMFQN